jgi:signal transduction histidine kinase/CheY-like chemotaxis protein/streptogramin lyase
MVVLTLATLFALSVVPARTCARGVSEASAASPAASAQRQNAEPAAAEEAPRELPADAGLPNRPQTPLFHHLTIDDGLTHNTVFHVLQDRRGFIWATTIEGINKYDGMTMTNFTPQAPGSQSTPQFYQTLLEDRDGILWFCNYGAGLVRHDPVLNTWKYYQHDDDNPNSLANDTLWLLFQDRDGILWISTFDGLSRFDPATEQFTNYFHDPNDPNSLGGTVAGQVQQAADGSLWVGTFGGGLDKFDPATETFTHHRHDPDNPHSLSDDNVGTIWMDPDGKIWVGTNNGLNHFDPVSGRCVRYRHDDKDDNSLSHNFVVHVERDSRGGLWISTWGGGLNRFDAERQQFNRYRSDPHDPDSLSSDLGLYFSEDRSGALWFGTTGGINRYDPAGQRFARYQHLPDDPNSLPAGQVREITQDADGIFWIAMWDQGLVRFDRAENTYTRYQAEPNNPNSLSNDNIFDIRYDPRGWLWVATTAGLNKFDLSSETWTQYLAEPGNPNALSTDWVSGVELGAKGDLWLAVYGAGLHHFDPVSEIFTRYSHDPKNPHSMPANENLNYVKAAVDGRLWVGGDASISLFDPVTEKAINFTPAQHGISGLGSHQTFQDRHGSIWVSTFSGVNKYDPDTNRFTPYPNIGTILADDAKGHLWAIAGKSLARFDPDTGSLRRYDEHDGLLSNSLEPTGGYTSPDGEIFVGGAKGFNSFLPDQMPDNPLPPPVALTEFELRSEPVAVGDDSPLQQHISVAEKITLPYDYTALTLKFAALNYRAPQKNQYAYMLEGFDQDWVQTDSTNRLATYTNLDPGQYTFRVKAANNDGVWNEAGAALKITITPPWWETWWLRGLAGLAVVGFLVAGSRYRERRLHRRTVELERQVNARTHELQRARDRAEKARHTAEAANRAKSEFLAHMSHELRTPLNGILGYADILARRVGGDASLVGGLDIIRKSGEHLLTLINDVLDLARVEAGKMELHASAFHLPRFLRQITEIVRERAEAKNLALTYEELSPLPVRVMADETRLRQVLLNLLGNAVKFTDHGHVSLTVTALDTTEPAPGTGMERATLRFSVEDTGIGLSHEQIGTIFHPFEQAHTLDRRVEGAGLGLAISRQIVDFMGGRLEVQSTVGQGSTFWFEVALPVTDVADPKPPTPVHAIDGYAGAPRSVLVVDDKRYNRQVLSDLLEPLGFSVHTAEDGQAAMDKAVELRPDVILMDLVMPVMTGMDAAREIRLRPELNQTALIAVSASVLEADREKSRMAGFDAFVPKPVRRETLLETLATHLQLTWIYAEPSAASEAPLKPPPYEELEQLCRLAVEGRIFDIQDRASQLKTLDEAHVPFARHLEKVAKGYDTEKIEAFIREMMEVYNNESG